MTPEKIAERVSGIDEAIRQYVDHEFVKVANR